MMRGSLKFRDNLRRIKSKSSILKRKSSFSWFRAIWIQESKSKMTKDMRQVLIT